MDNPSTVTRRALLAAGGVTVVGAGTLVLAACTPSGAGIADATGPSGGSGNSDGSGGSDGSATAPKIAAGTEVAKLADIPVGGSVSAKIGSDPILLAQPTAGKVVCFSAICTHQGCVVAAAATEFDCPCHGSRFEAATGKVLQGPAVNPLNPIAVSVSGDSVVTS